MTNLNKFAAQQLTKKQMNRIFGGEKCADGSEKFICGIDMGGGFGGGGVVCALNRYQALQMVAKVYYSIMQDMEAGEIKCVPTL